MNQTKNKPWWPRWGFQIEDALESDESRTKVGFKFENLLLVRFWSENREPNNVKSVLHERRTNWTMWKNTLHENHENPALWEESSLNALTQSADRSEALRFEKSLSNSLMLIDRCLCAYELPLRLPLHEYKAIDRFRTTNKKTWTTRKNNDQKANNCEDPPVESLSSVLNLRTKLKLWKSGRSYF